MTAIDRMRCLLQTVINERAKLNQATTIEKIGLIVLPILFAVTTIILINVDSRLLNCSWLPVAGFLVALYAFVSVLFNFPVLENVDKALNCIIKSSQKSFEVVFETLKNKNMTDMAIIIQKDFEQINRFNSLNVFLGGAGLLLFMYCLPRGKAPLLALLGATSIFLISLGIIARDNAFKPIDLKPIQGNLTKCLE